MPDPMIHLAIANRLKEQFGEPWSGTNKLRTLQKSMISSAMDRLLALGHRSALLGTEIWRIPAINIYLEFGFRLKAKDDRG